MGLRSREEHTDTSELWRRDARTDLDTGRDADHVLKTNGRQPLELLLRLTEHIPPNLKLHVTNIVVDDTNFKIVGQTTDHGAAGHLVQALNEMTGCEVDPPRTKLRKDRTVEFQIRARMRHDG